MEASKFLDQLLKAQNDGWVSPVHLARVYAGLGEPDRVFQQLERGFERRDQYMLWIKADIRFDPVRDDPRFKALLRRMNME